jgi:hypothetical protein
LTIFLEPLTFARSADERLPDMIRINAGQFLITILDFVASADSFPTQNF